MRKAIVTKYLGPTNHRGSRIMAKAEGGHQTIVSYDGGLTTEENHQAAAETLKTAAGWAGELVGGGMPDGAGYCFVFVS